ncbi:MAG: hypothetical protein WBW53_09825 [Terriglobales bacterium]
MLNYKARLLRNRCQIAARVGSVALVEATDNWAGVESKRRRSRGRCQGCEICGREKFREKYSAKMVTKYISKFDAAGVEEIELQTEGRMRFGFPEDKPRQQPDAHQRNAKSRYKHQRARRPHTCHEPPA